MVKSLNLPIDYVLYEMSYTNMLLYSASLPSYRKPNKGKDCSKEEIINGDDPNMQSEISKLFDESNRHR